MGRGIGADSGAPGCGRPVLLPIFMDQPEDLKTAFVHADRGSLDPPTTHVWCWTHARDYATFAAFYAPPPWCAAAWRALGFGSAGGVFSS